MKPCPPGKIRNPETNRCVGMNTDKGKKIVAERERKKLKDVPNDVLRIIRSKMSPKTKAKANAATKLFKKLKPTDENLVGSLKKKLPYKKISTYILKKDLENLKIALFDPETKTFNVNMYLEEEDEYLLHYAVYKGDYKTIEWMVNNGANLSLKDYWGDAPLHYATRSEKIDICDLLLSKGADINAYGSYNTPLEIAVEKNNFELFELLIKKGANINSETSSRKTTPLIVASFNGYMRFVEYLVKKGADVNLLNENGESALYMATLRGFIDICKYLVKNGANVNIGKNHIVPIFAAAGNLSILKLLVEHGADLKHYDKMLYGSILHAVINKRVKGYLEIMDYLISKGADVNAKNRNGRTPLHVSAFLERLETCEYLLKKGANINAIDDKGMTPLHLAASTENKQLCEFFITNYKDVIDLNAKDNSGQTAAHVAAKKGYKKLYEYLESVKGYIKRVKNVKGRTTYDLYDRYSEKKYGVDGSLSPQSS